jgi:4-hydroxy-tetrahydrodipicolinate synthase
MTMLKPQGIITPIITPMNPDESVNTTELRAQINRQIRCGVNGLFCLGTNGEVYALSLEEKLEIMKTLVQEVKGRVPVYAGTGCIRTSDTIDLSIRAKEIGVDAISVVSPYYVAVSQDDIYDYYSEIAQAVDLPMILYNIPARTGNNIDYKTVKKLAKYPNVVGVKDSSGNFDNTLRYLENTDPRLSILAGSDSLILWTLLAGGVGAIAGTANVFPEIAVNIYKLWSEGRMEEAKAVQFSLRPFRDVMAMGNPNSVVKRAMNLLGYPVGPARRPVSGTGSQSIDDALKKVFELYR